MAFYCLSILSIIYIVHDANSMIMWACGLTEWSLCIITLPHSFLTLYTQKHFILSFTYRSYTGRDCWWYRNYGKHNAPKIPQIFPAKPYLTGTIRLLTYKKHNSSTFMILLHLKSSVQHTSLQRGNVTSLGHVSLSVLYKFIILDTWMNIKVCKYTVTM